MCLVAVFKVKLLGPSAFFGANTFTSYPWIQLNNNVYTGRTKNINFYIVSLDIAIY